MKKTVNIKITKPQYTTITDVTFAQTDFWFGHSRRDLKLDIIYPEDCEKRYPCIVWICGGGWRILDKSAHLAYLSMLAREGFVVASVEYRTSNEEQYPAQLKDVKTAIRYLKAHAKRFCIDEARFGVMGESAGGHLAALSALISDHAFEEGQYLEYSSAVQAACTWYPVIDLTGFSYPSTDAAAASIESELLGCNVERNKEKALSASPISYVTKEAPPFLIIHGTDDHTVPFSQGELFHDKLEAAGCDVKLIAIEGAEHAETRFFQDEIWEEIISFFKEKL